MLTHYKSATTQAITGWMRVADVKPTTMLEGGREALVQQTEGIYVRSRLSFHSHAGNQTELA